jgi:hypothetical protein
MNKLFWLYDEFLKDIGSGWKFLGKNMRFLDFKDALW